jgi:hypothetical protein
MITNLNKKEVIAIVIPFANLTEEEQISLFIGLHDWAKKGLPDGKDLIVQYITKPIEIKK